MENEGTHRTDIINQLNSLASASISRKRVEDIYSGLDLNDSEDRAMESVYGPPSGKKPARESRNSMKARRPSSAMNISCFLSTTDKAGSGRKGGRS